MEVCRSEVHSKGARIALTREDVRPRPEPLCGLGVTPRVVRPLCEVHRTALDIAALHRLDRARQQIGGEEFGARDELLQELVSGDRERFPPIKLSGSIASFTNNTKTR
jgi:hypothetical protein